MSRADQIVFNVRWIVSRRLGEDAAKEKEHLAHYGSANALEQLTQVILYRGRNRLE